MIPASRRRLVVLYVVLAALLLGLGARAWFLQIAQAPLLRRPGQPGPDPGHRQPPVRGEIVDDTGAPMVSNRSALVVSVNMSTLSQQADGGTAELRRLAALLRHEQTRRCQLKVRLCTATVSASRAGRARRTSRSRWRSTSPTRSPSRSWRASASSPA